MNVSRAVARVYARALLDLAERSRTLARVVDDLHAVGELFERAETFRGFFLSPRIEPAAKKRALGAALGRRIGREVLGLLHVLVDKRREPVLDNIVDEFDRFRDLREGRVHVHVATARPLEPFQRSEIAAGIEKRAGVSAEVHERVDPRLIGGIVVKVGDRVLDGSLRRRLERLRRELETAHGT